MVGQAIQHDGGHLGVAKNLRPFGKGEIGHDQQRGVFVEFADQVEKKLPDGLAERLLPSIKPSPRFRHDKAPYQENECHHYRENRQGKG